MVNMEATSVTVYKRVSVDELAKIKANDIDELATGIKQWSDATFPDRTDASMFIKLFQEIGEMTAADPEHVGGELADVLIMLLDFGRRRGLDIGAEVRRKMAINVQRQWQRNEHGVYQHV